MREEKRHEEKAIVELLAEALHMPLTEEDQWQTDPELIRELTRSGRHERTTSLVFPAETTGL